MLEKIGSLPEQDQRVLAAYLADHLEQVLDDARWQQLVERSPDLLDRMSDEVDQAIAAGDFAELDPEEL